MNTEDILGSVLEVAEGVSTETDPSLLVGIGAAFVVIYIAAAALAKITPTTKDDEFLAKARPVYVYIVSFLSRRGKK